MATKNRYVYEPPVKFRLPLVAILLLVAVLFKLAHGSEEHPSQDTVQEIPFHYMFRSLNDDNTSTSASTTFLGDDLIFGPLETKPQRLTEEQIKLESFNQLPPSVFHIKSASYLLKSVLDQRFQKIKDVLTIWRAAFSAPFIMGQLFKLDFYAGLTMSASMQTYFHFCSKLTESEEFQTEPFPLLPGAPQLQCTRLAECFGTKNSLILEAHSRFISAVLEFQGLLAAFGEAVECAQDSKECQKSDYEYHRQYPPTPTTTTSTTWRSRRPGTNDDEVTIPTPNPSTSTTVAPPPGSGSYGHHSYGSSYCHVSKKVTDRYTSKLQTFCVDFNSINIKLTDSLESLKTSILPFWDCTLATMEVCQNSPGGDCQLSFCRDLVDNSNIFANRASAYVDSFMAMWTNLFERFKRDVPATFATLFES